MKPPRSGKARLEWVANAKSIVIEKGEDMPIKDWPVYYFAYADGVKVTHNKCPKQCLIDAQRIQKRVQQIAKMLQDNRDMRRVRHLEMDWGKRKVLEKKMRVNTEEIAELKINGFIS